jgi:Rieske Fe-S protein
VIGLSENETSRRNLLYGIAAVGVAAPVLAACGSSGNSDSGGSGASSANGSGSAAAEPIKTSEIPVGGGKIFTDPQIVVTQPTAGDFKAFSSICTHQGCPVTKISDGTIDCPCHGSSYSITDGSVQGGPAPKPLPSKTVTVAADGSTLTVS